MRVNESVYGNPSQWYSQHFTQNIPPQYRNKKPYFDGTNARLETAIANNKIIGGQPIDSSISYCGLGFESDLSHANSICRIDSDIVVKSVDRDITNFMIWEKSESQSFSRMNGALCDNNQYGWKKSLTSDNINRYIEPLCSIKPTNQVLEIRVFAYSPTLNTTIDVDLDTYCNGGFIVYPQIQTVYVECQWGSSPERGANIPNYEYMNVKFCIGLLDPYKYIDDTDVYNYALSANDRSNIGILSGLSNPVYNINAVSDNIPVFYGSPDMYTVATTSGTMIRVYRDVSTENIDDVKEYYIRQAACFGLYFSPKHQVAINGTLTDTDMYIGILDSDGVGHGEYLKGTNTVNAPQNNLTDMFEIGYNPNKSDDTNYTNNTLFQNQLATHSAIKYYVMSAEQVGQLFAKLHDATISNQQTGESITDTNLKTLLTTNGIDVITSFMKFPCEPPSYIGPFDTIHLGTYDTGIIAGMLQYQTAIYDFTFNRGKKNSLREHFDGSFLDREEYTKAELTIPFCGTVEIPTTYLYQYDDLTVKLIIDFITGACTAIIMVHDIAIDSISGSCGVQLPVTGVQSASLNAALDSVAKYGKTQERSQGMQLLGGFAAMGLGIATGNIFAAAAGGLTMLNSLTQTANTATQINYELTHMQLPLKQVGGASAAINQTLDMRCKLRITRPVMSDDYNAEIYAKNIGFACLINGSVKDFTDLTIGDICTDGIGATTDEKNMIQTLFKTGVYL